MEFEQPRAIPQNELSAVLSTYQNLVSDYAAYLDCLGKAVESLETADKLQREIRALSRSDYAAHIPESARAGAFLHMLTRIEKIDPKASMFALTDITPMRQLVAKDLGDTEPDELFLKLCDFEKIMSCNLDVCGGDRTEESFAVSELQKYSTFPLEALTTDEHARCVSLVLAARENARVAADRKLASRDNILSDTAVALKEQIERQPSLLLRLKDQSDILRPTLETFNAWAIDTYHRRDAQCEPISLSSDVHAVKPYLQWRYDMLGNLESATHLEGTLSKTALNVSLEDKLGGHSSINHFDIFLLRPRGHIEFFSHFHQTLSMRLLLAIANPACDAFIFQGSEGTISSDRIKRGADFVVPALGGIVDIEAVKHSGLGSE